MRAGDAPSSASSSAPQAPPQLSWEDVGKSKSLFDYARFLEQHPATEHRAELEKLIADFFRDTIAKAQADGKSVIRNATEIKASVSGGAVSLSPGSVLVVQGGGIYMGDLQWLSDPFKPLVLVFGSGVIKVEQGRGIALWGKDVYCFGLE
jgi:hypothetical protein